MRRWDSHACPFREAEGDKALSDPVSNGSALPHIYLFTFTRVKLMARDLRQCTQRHSQSRRLEWKPKVRASEAGGNKNTLGRGHACDMWILMLMFL